MLDSSGRLIYFHIWFLYMIHLLLYILFHIMHLKSMWFSSDFIFFVSLRYSFIFQALIFSIDSIDSDVFVIDPVDLFIYFIFMQRFIKSFV